MNRQSAKLVPEHFSDRRTIQCPKCFVGMSTITVSGISLERCPLCEGVFFDKGEVESLIRKNLRFEKFMAFHLVRWS